MSDAYAAWLTMECIRAERSPFEESRLLSVFIWERLSKRLGSQALASEMIWRRAMELTYG